MLTLLIFVHLVLWLTMYSELASKGVPTLAKLFIGLASFAVASMATAALTVMCAVLNPHVVEVYNYLKEIVLTL